MMSEVRIVRVVVASPGDVRPEREALHAILDELNRGVALDRNLRLELSRWETDVYPGFHVEGPQGLIDSILKIDDCDVLVGIFWKRFGTPTLDAQSGTEHEILSAYESWKQSRRPQIMVYFKESAYSPQSKEEIDQWRQVLEFKENFPKEGLWWSYKRKTQFASLVRNHLSQFIRSRFPIDSQDIYNARDKESVTQSSLDNSSCRSLSTLVEEYRSQLKEFVSKVYIFGDRESRELNKIFVELNIIREYQRPSVYTEYLSLMDTEMRERRNIFSHRNEFAEIRAVERDKKKDTIAPDELLHRLTQAVITGAPGCGKTTLLKYLVMKTMRRGNRLPIFLELKTLTEESLKQTQNNLPELLFNKAIAARMHLGLAENTQLKEFFFSRLAAGEMVIFLDGLDEVRGTGFFSKLCDSINEFLRTAYRSNTLIITTRPYALQVRFEGLQEMEIAPFDQYQIRRFLIHYYGDKQESKQLLQKLLQFRQIRELLRIPFLLGVILQLYSKHKHIVENRLELYRQVVWQLVGQLDREKGVDRFYISHDSDGSLKLDFLKQLALERLLVDSSVERESTQEVGRLLFTGEILLEKAKQFLSQAGRSDVNPYWLAADVKATPLLREIGADTYAFAHLTIHEYLAAMALLQRNDYARIFCHSYFQPTLAEMEVLPMTMGAVNKPDGLYESLERLPESLVFANLRMRARSLAYMPKIGQRNLSILIDKLIQFINEDNVEETPYRGAVIGSFSSLAGWPLKYVLDRITPLLNSDNLTARWNAARAIRQIGGREALAELIADMESGSEPRHDSALLGHEEEVDIDDSTEPFDPLYLLKSELRFESYYTYGELGMPKTLDEKRRPQEEVNQTIEGLVTALTSESSSVRAQAYEAFEQVDEKKIVVALAEVLKSGALDLRWRAIEALGQLGTMSAIYVLLESLKSEYKDVRGHAASTLGQIKFKPAERPLIEALKDEDSNVRWRAAAALGQVGGEQALDALVNALSDEDIYVPGSAASSLGYLGGERAVAALKIALHSKHSYVRGRAVSALGIIGGDHVVTILVEALAGDPDEYIRGGAAAVLGAIGGERALLALVEALRVEEGYMRVHVVDALKNFKGEKAIHELIEALNDKDGQVRSSAADALRDIKVRRAVPELIKLLGDPDDNVRISAATTLGFIGDESAIPPLIAGLSDSGQHVRVSAAAALEQADRRLLADGLVKAIKYDEAFVRRVAARVVGYYVNNIQVLNELSDMADTDPAVDVRDVANDSREKLSQKMRLFQIP